MGKFTDFDLARALARFPAMASVPRAAEWFEIQSDMQAPSNSLFAYAYDLSDFFEFLASNGLTIADLGTREIAKYIKDLANRKADPDIQNLRNRKSLVGLGKSTARRRLSTVRLFLDYLVGEGDIGRNPARPNSLNSTRRSWTPTETSYPWIPNDSEWDRILAIVKASHLRIQTMFMLAYEAALRKEELCSLQLGDFDHADHRVTLRAETTKGKKSRVLPYGDLTDRLLIRYLNSAPGNIRDDEPIFRSISKRNYGEPITVHTWTKDVEKLRDTAMLPKFHPHTMRHLALTDLARSGWDILDIKEFAGHASLRSTEKYIHLSSRDLKKRYAATMNQLHSQRLQIMSLMFSANA